MGLKSFWNNKDPIEKFLLIFLILTIFFLIFMECVSGLTEEERIRNNQLLQEMEEKGEILIPEMRDYSQDLNPFFILGGLAIGIIILIYILIRLSNRDRL